MTEPIAFPGWILKSIDEHQDQLNPKSLDFFNKFVEIFPDFDKSFLSIPATLEVGALTSLEPGEIQKSLGIRSPLEFIILNTAELMHFHFVYQMRELGQSLLESLHGGKFFVAAIQSRATLEVVCTNYYAFVRAEAKMTKSFAFLLEAARTRSEKEKSRLLKDYYAGIYEVFSGMFDSNQRSSINWSDYLKDQFDAQVHSDDQPKKINVLTAIEDVGKKSNLPLKETYCILSEFVHPNVGSKMLIINTRKQHHPLMDTLKMGDNLNNSEAALFYFDQLAEGSYYSWTLALSLFHRSQDFISKLSQLCGVERSQFLH
ncbi:hypothetical protein [Nioella sp.]|uniref:hypothetical protein n=1 Tax=Nioella sp. TaxID=1912091 RepID=UPI003A863922